MLPFRCRGHVEQRLLGLYSPILRVDPSRESPLGAEAHSLPSGSLVPVLLRRRRWIAHPRWRRLLGQALGDSLRAREWLSRSLSRPMHPGWLRYSSVTCEQYAPSSRLAIRAPRARSSTDLAIPGPLVGKRSKRDEMSLADQPPQHALRGSALCPSRRASSGPGGDLVGVQLSCRCAAGWGGKRRSRLVNARSRIVEQLGTSIA